MSTLNAWLAVLAGIAIMIAGAEMLVRGGSGLAARLAVPPIVIGLTIVSLGTSAPELAIGIESAAGGNAELAVGNIVGTNLVNLLVILGASAAMRSIALGMQTLRIDLPVIAVASILLYVLALDGELTTLDGVILIAYGAAYTVLIILMSRRESSRVVDEFDSKYADHQAAHPRSRLLRDIFLLGAGIAIVVGGADLLVDGALQIARSVGISEAVVGLTVIAIGTSAPELVTTLVSTVRDDRDIALGNLFGSSVSSS